MPLLASLLDKRIILFASLVYCTAQGQKKEQYTKAQHRIRLQNPLLFEVLCQKYTSHTQQLFLEYLPSPSDFAYSDSNSKLVINMSFPNYDQFAGQQGQPDGGPAGPGGPPPQDPSQMGGPMMGGDPNQYQGGNGAQPPPGGPPQDGDQKTTLWLVNTNSPYCAFVRNIVNISFKTS